MKATEISLPLAQCFGAFSTDAEFDQVKGHDVFEFFRAEQMLSDLEVISDLVKSGLINTL